MANGEARVALVTGANKGIGKEIARGLAKQGLVVLMGSRDADRGEAAAAELQGDGKAVFVQLDVTSDASVQAAVSRVADDFHRLDVLVNNSGILVLPDPEKRSTVQTMHDVFDVNLYGVVRVTEAFLPLLKAAPHASIVNVSSGLGSIKYWLGDPPAFLRGGRAIPYCVSKTALNALTVHWADMLADTKVKVNAADPGYCATDLNNHSGPRSSVQGAMQPIKLALVGPDGPTATYTNDDGPVEW